MPEDERKKIVSLIYKKGDVAEDVEYLRNWLRKQPHLPDDLDEDLLHAFVNNTKTKEKMKKKLDTFFTMRGKINQMYGLPSRDPLDPDFQESFQAFKMFFLPRPASDGSMVLFMSGHTDFSKFQHQMFDIRWMMMAELAIKKWPNNGNLALIVDASGIDSSVVRKFSPATSATSMRWIESALPGRLTKIVYFNAATFIDVIYSMIKPFISKKIIERILITAEGPEVLKKHFNIDIFPKEYGGKEKSSEELNNEWLDQLVQHREWFLESVLQCSDDSRRPADYPNDFDDYGINGSFKYLQID